MKRNRFGINLDEGIPLFSQKDFELLYVPFFNDEAARLRQWTEEGEKPLLLGGQIGSGKSTLIRCIFNDNTPKPDIEIRFDTETLNKDAGDFWGITLAEFIKAALKHHIDLSFSKLPEELGGFAADNWNSLLKGISPDTFSMEPFDQKKKLHRKIADNREYIRKTVSETGKRLQTKLKRPLFIFASGVDKFNQSSPAFFDLEEILAALTAFKTLFEVNVIHLFSRSGTTFHSIERLLIPTARPNDVNEMLTKRMGVYAQTVRQPLETLTHWSGGNPRQAVRLLSHFQTARKSKKRNIAETLAAAVHETTGDFFAYSPRPSLELMTVTRKTNKIETSLLTLPGDPETAARALYGNWILLEKPINAGAWKAAVNPIVKAAFDTELHPEDPEMKMLSEYALQYGISREGLDFNVIDEGTGKKKSGDRIQYYFVPLHARNNSNRCFDRDVRRFWH